MQVPPQYPGQGPQPPQHQPVEVQRGWCRQQHHGSMNYNTPVNGQRPPEGYLDPNSHYAYGPEPQPLVNNAFFGDF